MLRSVNSVFIFHFSDIRIAYLHVRQIVTPEIKVQLKKFSKVSKFCTVYKSI